MAVRSLKSGVFLESKCITRKGATTEALSVHVVEGADFTNKTFGIGGKGGVNLEPKDPGQVELREERRDGKKVSRDGGIGELVNWSIVQLSGMSCDCARLRVTRSR